jgi:hypothetical protein
MIIIVLPYWCADLAHFSQFTPNWYGLKFRVAVCFGSSPTLFPSPSSNNITHCKGAGKEPSKIMVLQTKITF